MRPGRPGLFSDARKSGTGFAGLEIFRMTLRVAVQMDPIERINIKGDSTFALMLEAQARGFDLAVYAPETLSLREGRLTASVRPVRLRDLEGDHVTAGTP